MGVILDELFMLFATSKPFLQMASYGWENWPIRQKKTLLPSMLLSCSVAVFNQVYTPRERREHCVFRELLKSVAGLEERLMQDGDDEIDIIAELASTVHRS